MTKSIYILGAGASKATCEVPLVSEILVQAAMKAALSGDPDLKANLVEVLREIGLEDAIEQPVSQSLIDLGKWHVEDLLRRFSTENDVNAEQALKNVIFKVLGDRNYIARKEKYEPLIHHFFATHEPSAIISFNYDLCFDLAWANVTQAQNFPWSYSVNFEAGIANTFSSYKRLSQNCPPMFLLKLHGSFNFLQCPNCSALRLDYFEDYPSRKSGNTCKKCGEKGIFSTFLIAPEPGKQPPRELQEVWDTGKRLLRECDCLTVIGYSFGAADQHVIEFFQEALGKLDKEELNLVDPNEETRHRIAKLLGCSFSRKNCYAGLPDFLSS